MKRLTVVTYETILVDDEEEAMLYARRQARMADRIVIRAGSVSLRDYDRHTEVERVATGRAARAARRSG